MPVRAMNFGWPAAGTAVGRADKMAKIDVSDNVDKPADKSRRLALLCVFLITFGIRLIFIMETQGIAAFRTPNPGMDIDLHWQAARLLVQGASQKEPCFELMIPSTPFHPYWHALWQIILGESLVCHRVLNAVLASLSAVLIFMLIQSRVWLSDIYRSNPGSFSGGQTRHYQIVALCALCHFSAHGLRLAGLLAGAGQAASQLFQKGGNQRSAQPTGGENHRNRCRS